MITKILLIGGVLLINSPTLEEPPQKEPFTRECTAQDIQTFIRLGVSDKNIREVCYVEVIRKTKEKRRKL